jgi:hypothetical protein
VEGVDKETGDREQGTVVRKSKRGDVGHISWIGGGVGCPAKEDVSYDRM